MTLEDLVLPGLGSLAALIYSVGFELWPERHPSLTYQALYYPLLVLFAAAALWVWRRPARHRRWRLAWVLGFAVVFRLLAMGDPPSLSSDIHRYAWDGRVQRAGLSPYAFAPGDEEVEFLADDLIHPRINRPSARTIYPPGAQVLFAALPYDIDAIRGVMIALDLLTVLLITRLLVLLGLDPSRVLLYAWCPFVVYEVGNNGHLEAAMLPLLIGAVLAWHAGRTRLLGALVGAAAAMKLYPALAIIALGRPRPLRALAGLVAVPAALYLAYGWAAGADVLGFLPDYLRAAEDHNIGLRAALEALLFGLPHAREVAFGACNLMLLLGVTILWRRGGRPEDLLPAVIGLYLLTLPTAFHPWYALWLVPWLCIRPRAAWLWLLATLPLSYLKYASPDGVMPGWVRPLEFGPTFALLAWSAWRGRGTHGGSTIIASPIGRRSAAHRPSRTAGLRACLPPPTASLWAGR